MRQPHRSSRHHHLGFGNRLHAAWHQAIGWTKKDNERQTYQDEGGRLWDVLACAMWTIRWNNAIDNPLLFDVDCIPRDGHSVQGKLLSLKLVIGPGDRAEPVGTIMLPTED